MIIPLGYPKAKATIEATGYKTIEVDVSEFRKLDGGLSCLSLSDFAYRIELTPSVFIIAGLIAFFISLLTVGYHAVKAALANPVNSLRYE